MSQSLENGHASACDSIPSLESIEVKSDTATKESRETVPNCVPNGLHFDEDKIVQIHIKMSIMKPFEEQIAGHGMVDGKVLLKHPDGRVLKPQQPPPKGIRELGFYQNISTSSDPDDVMIRRVVPEFYGVAKNERGEEFLVLKDITQGMAQPTVIDIKIGSQTWIPGASEEKRAKERKKYLGTRPTLGFSVSGMLVHCLKGDDTGSNSLLRVNKKFGMELKTEDVTDIPDLFFDVKRSGPVRRDLVETVIAKMHDTLRVLEAQRKYNFYSSSLLMAYDADAVRKVHLSCNGNNGGETRIEQTKELENHVNVSIVDFANVVMCQDKDDNFIQGLKNLISIFEGVLK